MGKAKRLKKSRANQPLVSAKTYSPGQLAVDEGALGEQLVDMPAEMLPFYGLAAQYLASSPIRDANQCLLASTVLMLVMRNYGIEANLVSLELDIDWANEGKGVHHGRPDPKIVGTDVHGHIGLLTEEWFLDATASQFPEVRDNGGVRPVGGHIGGPQAAYLAQHGGKIQVSLSTGRSVQYTIHRVGSADGVGSKFISMQPNKNALAIATMNLMRVFTVTLAATRPDVRTPYPKLNAAVRAAVGKTLVNRDGLLELVDGTEETPAG